LWAVQAAHIFLNDISIRAGINTAAYNAHAGLRHLQVRIGGMLGLAR
jgi:hypothetical protein